MHLTCTNMPVDMVDKALKVRVSLPSEAASPETPFCRLAYLFSLSPGRVLLHRPHSTSSDSI